MAEEDKGTTSIFGNVDDDLFAEETQAPAQEPAPETPTEPEVETPPETTPEEPQDPVATEEPAEPEATPDETQEAPAAEEPQLIGGKFKTPEDVLLAYQQAERLATQRAQETASLRREQQQIHEALRRSAPILQRAQELMRQQQDPQQELDPQEQDELQRIQSYLGPLVEKQVQERVAPLMERVEAQRAQQGEQVIDSFLATHEQARPTEVQERIVSIINENRFDGQEEIFPPTRENLETALKLATNEDAYQLLQALNMHPEADWVDHAIEASSNPSLKEVVLAVPSLIETEAGMNYARKQAGLSGVVATATANGAEALKAQQEADRKAAHVEKDEGTPEGGAPGRKARDPLEEYVNELDAQKQSIFLQ